MFIKNETVLITGSSRGIGKGLALIFSKNGYNVIIHGRDKKQLENVKGEIEKNNVNCHVIIGDINSEDVLDNLLEISKREDISILINNVGLACPHLPLQEIHDEHVKNIIQTNLIAPIKLTRRIYPFFMKKKSGMIININSLSGLEDHYLRTIYCASKWGLRGFTETLRREAKDHNVRVGGVYPGWTKTKPEITVGMTVDYVSKKVFEFCKSTEEKDLILDNRLKKVKKNG